MEFAPLRLKKNEERRLRAGHLWVFSNEVDTTRTPLTDLQAGQPVEILAASGKPVGTGYVNPNSLICARLMSRDARHPFSESLLVHRLKVALSLRQMLFAHPCYRLVHSEGDGLPGLVVDRFNDVLVVQITTAGMERMKQAVVAALDKVLKPKAVLLRNDTPLRAIEGLESYVEEVIGHVPDEVELEENGVAFRASPRSGQKTGWFYDHRMNRARVAPYVQGKRVLDVFSYIGAWGIQAAVAGASEVMCLDSSEAALDAAYRNARLNAVENKFVGLEGNAFEALRALRLDHQKFDVVILDPPAFIKRKKDLKEGTLAYRRINQLAMQVLAKDGILVSASCSYHLPRGRLQETLLQAARHVDRNLQIIEQGHQGPDHPVHPAIVETDYLKSFTTRVLRG